MRGNPYDVHARAFAALQTRLGTDCPQFIWGGNSYAIIPSTAQLKKRLVNGGFELDYDLLFNCLAGQFFTQTLVTVANVKDAMLETFMQYLSDLYKIKYVRIGGGGQILTIGANAQRQGAGGV